LLDPNEGFGRNQAKPPLKSKEERLEEDGETFSDDDGEQRGAPCLAQAAQQFLTLA
jgi:hypothetical protein